MSERILNVDHQAAIEYSGKKFRSNLEVQTAKTLDGLGIPYSYEEKKIVLQEGFRCPYQKDKVRDLTYCPDFTIGSSILIECKGFETPEWKIKKKILFKWLMENEPGTCFYQIHDARKQLLEMLDHQWQYLGYAVEVKARPTRKEPNPPSQLFDSIEQAMAELGLKGKPVGSILRSLTGKNPYVFGYSWKLKKLEF